MTIVCLASRIINDHEMNAPIGTIQHPNKQSISRCMTEGQNTDIIMLNCVTPISSSSPLMKIFLYFIANDDKDSHQR